MAHPALEILYGGSAGGGKALKLDTPIPTPDGWTTMGALNPGDRVFDENGKPCKVLAATPVMIGRPCYEVEFSDGSVIVADAEHEWWTFDYKARGQLIQRTDEWRARRRADRPKRGTGKRPDLAERNSKQTTETKGAPTGALFSTAQLAATLRARNGTHLNHAIAACKPLGLPEADLPIDPYLLGAWLGDGFTDSGALTVGHADHWMLEAVGQTGWTIHGIPSDDMVFRVDGLTAVLRRLGVLGNKRIPMQYLRASVEQRLALLQGIIDTDGYVDVRGQVELCWTKRELVDDFMDLVAGLGIVAQAREGRATLNGRDCGPKWRVKFTTTLPAARMPRKAERQKREGFRATNGWRYIVDVRPVASVPVKCIAAGSPSHLYLAGRAMIPTHNSAGLLMAALQYVDVPGYSAILLRRTYRDLALPGALMDMAAEWLSPTDAVWRAQDMTWRFPSGATLTFGAIDIDQDKYKYQGSAFAMVGFDELTQQTESAYRYLFSRLRRPANSNVPIRMRATSNPGGRGHEWVRSRFIDSTEPDRVFIPAGLSDNPHLDAASYEHSLSNLDPVTRAQLLRGDWSARADGGYFRREWFEIVESAPANAQRVRYWDFAATEAKAGSDPDWTAGAKVALKDGVYYIEDMAHARTTPEGVQRLVKQAAALDGKGVPIIIEQEPGSSGKTVLDHYKRIVLVGWPVREDKVTGDKATRAMPFSSAAEAGNVKLVRGGWVAKFLDEAEAFPQGSHDDMVDATSGAFQFLSSGHWGVGEYYRRLKESAESA